MFEKDEINVKRGRGWRIFLTLLFGINCKDQNGTAYIDEDY